MFVPKRVERCSADDEVIKIEPQVVDSSAGIQASEQRRRLSMNTLVNQGAGAAQG
jgi:hypothetical protein